MLAPGLWGAGWGGEWFHDNERIRAVVAFMRDTFPELQSQPRIESEPVVEYQETAGEPEIRSSWLEFRSVYTKLDGTRRYYCLLYTSDAADERSSVDLGGRRIIKKKNI